MLPVSNAFLTAIKAPSRQLDAKVFMQLETSFLMHSSPPSGYGKIQFYNCTEAWDSKGYQLINGVTKKIFEEVGFTSVETSDFYGVFIVSSYLYPTIAVRFPAMYVNKIRFVCDPTGGYPVDFDVAIATAGVGNAKLITFTNNTVADRTIDLGGSFLGDHIYIVVRQWSKGNVPIKFLEFTPCLIIELTKNEIISMKIEETISNGEELTIGSVAAKSLSLVIDDTAKNFYPDNPTSLYGKYMLPNVKIMPYIGVWTGTQFEYANMGVYYADKWEVAENDLSVTVTGLDIIAQIDNLNFTTVYLYGVGTNQQIFDEQMTHLKLNLTADYAVYQSFPNTGLPSLPVFKGNSRDFLLYFNELGTFCLRKERKESITSTTGPGENLSLTSAFDILGGIKEITFENMYKKGKSNKIKSGINTLLIDITDGTQYCTAPPNEPTITHHVVNNPFIRDTTWAQRFATEVGNRFYGFNKFIEIEWQGNPGWELQDAVMIWNDAAKTSSVQGLIFSQTFEYDGGLVCTTIAQIF